ncbi:MAG: dihydrolipoyl dehydrogenase [Myxococcales bacterium]|nr:dihydrolipoyl dehydrogenase [Myxococcales bacterium]
MSETQNRFDVVVIGAGPGGYVAAIRAAQLGMTTACVDSRGALGGTCLNVGCIPSKALLHSSERFAAARDRYAEHGIELGEVKLDLGRMMSRKDDVVAGLTKGIGQLFKKNGVEHVHGTGCIPKPGEVEVALEGGGTRTLVADRIVIATGSDSTPLPGVEIDEKRIVTSTGALALDAVPEHLVVVGAGVIGLELGSVWRRLGARVTVIEYLDRILPGMDHELARHAQRLLGKQGLEFRLSSAVKRAEVGTDAVALSVEAAAGGAAESLQADVVLVAVGRRPYTEGLGLDEVGVTRDDRGFIQVDDRFETSVPGIHAIGDCIPGPMLAHKAEEDGVVCVEMLAGQSGHVDYGKVPAVVYTAPEIAGVGKTEDELREAGVGYNAGKFPFLANSRGRAIGETDGFVKVLADAKADRLLGVHIIGPFAGDLLQEAVVALEFGASAEDLARTVHSHPAMGEAVKEAALAALGRAIHV